MDKRYEEALERARQGLPIDKIFPELYESEDERIRKLLVWQVHRNIEDETSDLAQSVYDGIKGHDPDLEESIENWKKCLAYLERQKEQKPERINITEMVAKYRATDEYVEGEYKGKPVNCMIRAYEQGIYDTLLKVKEQKPAEWSEEDEKLLDAMIDMATNSLYEPLCPRGKMIALLKSLRP